MSVRVYTARVTYRGPDRLDITRKSGDPTFAPSWAILRPMLKLRSAGEHLAAWPQYVLDYTAEMRLSYRSQRTAWDALLSRSEITLCCYCVDAQHCHRTVLAGILGKAGSGVVRRAMSGGPRSGE